MEDLNDILAKAKFDVEHALSMYAYSFLTLPAESIYDKVTLTEYNELIKSCHIYIIGFLPIVDLVEANQIGRKLELNFEINQKAHVVTIPIPPNYNLINNEQESYLQNDSGEKSWIKDFDALRFVNEQAGPVEFKIQYIGQAYGKDGSRNAIDRLLKHETLQKISLRGVPKGQRLSLLLLEVESNNRLATVFNPFAKNKNEGGKRIKAGIDKLFGTTEQERISLYEASLIRYFSPLFNKEFKNSFPSTNLKVLQDCYKKDLSAVIAEISFDELPFQLCSNSVKPQRSHMCTHHLHSNIDRKVFFYGD
jgi:hypothetical protein